MADVISEIYIRMCEGLRYSAGASFLAMRSGTHDKYLKTSIGSSKVGRDGEYDKHLSSDGTTFTWRRNSDAVDAVLETRPNGNRYCKFEHLEMSVADRVPGISLPKGHLENEWFRSIKERAVPHVTSSLTSDSGHNMFMRIAARCVDSGIPVHHSDGKSISRIHAMNEMPQWHGKSEEFERHHLIFGEI